MTADAKVGLLLGLAFIVIIAFLINGLPNFWDSSRSKTGLDSELTNLSGNGFILEDQARLAVRNVNLRTSPPPTEERAIVKLNSDTQNESSGLKSYNETSDNIASENTNSIPRTYIVKSGESLASIAKKIYGEIMGNKLDVVQHIYKANTNILETPHDIKVGQELTIPDLFTEVKSISPVNTDNPAPGVLERAKNKIFPPKPQYREYIVKKKDSLWSIAQKQLANGNRYNEILNLNQSIIKSPGELTPGMKLKLPNL